MSHWIDKFDYYRIKKELVCLQKPEFILKKLEKYDKPIICTDIDNYFLNKPVIPEINFDIGFIFRPKRKLSVSNSLHIWNPTENTKRFLNMWSYLCQWPELTYLSDHHRLNSVIEWVKQEKNAKHIRSTTNIINLFEYFKDSFIEGIIGSSKEPVYRTFDGTRCQIKRGNYAK